MRRYRLDRPPRSLRRSAIYLDNIALVPASLLPLKAKWRTIANDLPQGQVLIVLPYQARQQQVARSVAASLEEKGQRVRLLALPAASDRPTVAPRSI